MNISDEGGCKKKKKGKGGKGAFFVRKKTNTISSFGEIVLWHLKPMHFYFKCQDFPWFNYAYTQHKNQG